MTSIAAELSRSNRNLLVVNFCLLLGAVGWAGYHQRVLRSCFSLSPTPFAEAAASGQLADRWVTLTADQVSAPVFEENTVNKVVGIKVFESLSALFHLVKVQDKFLLVKLEPGAEGGTLTGLLRKPALEIRWRMQDLDEQHPGLRKQLYREYLDCTDARLPWVLGGCLAAFFGLLAAFNLKRWWQRVQDPQQHPLLKSLAGAEQKLEHELQKPVLDLGKLILTPTWVLDVGFFGCEAHKAADLVWAHLKKKTAKLYHVVPVKTNNFIVMHFADGETSEVLLDGAQCEEGLLALAKLAPGAFYGYDEALAKRWREDRAGMALEAAARHAASH